ncbi:MAG: hypothetical protein PHH29_16965 [Desulfuromonadaceae bacterium]|nr:hypothetical protein [Desulfuromonadaceae bacterium]
MISTVTYNGDGATRIFPVAFEIRGEDYIVIFINDIGVSDRTTYDIINNSVVFRVGAEPVVGVDNVKIVVATSPNEIADLNAPPSSIQTILDNLVEVITVSSNITDVVNVSENILDIQIANTNSASIDIVSDNINDVNILADALGKATISGGGQFLGTTVIKGIQYMSQTLAEPIIVPSGLNAFSIDNLEVLSGGSITVSNDAVYKVL